MVAVGDRSQFLPLPLTENRRDGDVTSVADERKFAKKKNQGFATFGALTGLL